MELTSLSVTFVRGEQPARRQSRRNTRLENDPANASAVILTKNKRDSEWLNLLAFTRWHVASVQKMFPPISLPSTRAMVEMQFFLLSRKALVFFRKADYTACARLLSVTSIKTGEFDVARTVVFANVTGILATDTQRLPRYPRKRVPAHVIYCVCIFKGAPEKNASTRGCSSDFRGTGERTKARDNSAHQETFRPVLSS